MNVPIRPNESRSRALAKTMRRSMTHAEALLWLYLRRDALGGVRFRRQHPIGPFVADFACARARIIVEVDGATHGSEAEVAHDRLRGAYLAARGWREVRFTNQEIYDDLDGVLRAIARIVGEAPSTVASRRSPSPARGGGSNGERCSDA